MIFEKIKVVVEFGNGSVALGAGYTQINEVDQYWYISIKETNNSFKVGEIISKSDVVLDGNEIYLTFPSENQMLKVLAAFTNKTFEEVIDSWMAAKNKKLQESS